MKDKLTNSRRQFLKTVSAGTGVTMIAGCAANQENSEDTTNGTDTTTQTGDDSDDQSQESSTEFIYGKAHELTHMDQHAITDGTLSQLGLCFDNLVGYKKEDPTEITPHLASSYESNDDATEWTFELRQGIEFDDGTPFDSYAAKRSLERAKELEASQAEPYDWIDTIEETGDYEITIYCNDPFAPAVAALTSSTAVIYNPTVIDEHWEEENYGHQYFQENVHGTGPFKFEEWQQGNQWVAVRKDNHWREELDDLPEDLQPPENANIDTYRKVTIREELTQKQELSRGEIDIGEDLSWPNIQDLMEQDGVELHNAGADLKAKFVFMNTKREPTNDVNFRKALAYAVDYEALANELIQIATPMGTPWMEGIWPRLTEGQYRRDLEQAESYLNDSSYDGRELSLRYPSAPTNERIGEALSANFSEIGVQVDARGIAWGNLNEQWTNPESAPEMSMFTGFGNYSDPDAHGSRYNSENHPPNGFNVSYFENDRVDELIQQGATTADRSEREELYTEMQEIILDEAPMLWLYQDDWARPYNTDITNMSYTIGELNYLRVHDFHKD